MTNSMNEQEKFLTMRDILRPVFKWRCQVIIITVTALVVGILLAFLMPPHYRSETRILVKRASLGNDELVSDAGPKITSNLRQLNQKDDINTVIAMIESRDLLDQVIRDTGLTMKRLEYIPDYRYYVRLAYKGIRNFLRTLWNNAKYILHLSRRPTAEEIQALKHAELLDAAKKALKVKQITDSDVISVSFSCGDRTLARQLAEAICEHAIVLHNRERTQASATLQFFTEQTQKIKSRILELDDQLRDSRDPSDHIAANLKKQLIVEDQIKAESKLQEALARRDALKAGIRQLQKELDHIKAQVTVSSDRAVNPVWLGIEKELAAYKLQLAEKRTKFSDDSRVVQDLTTQVKETEKLLGEMERSIDRSRTRGMNTVYQKLKETMLSKKSQLAATEAEIERRRLTVADYKKKLLELNKKALQSTILKTEQEALEKAYKMYVQNAEQARLNKAKQNVRLANLVIVQHASFPLKASKPVKWLYILVSLVAGLMAGLTWAFIKDFNDTTYWNPDQLEKDLKIPVIGAIQDEEVSSQKYDWLGCLR